MFFFFFFFQAEDGIRDLTVTGVQTCALPICVLVTRNACWLIAMSIKKFIVIVVVALVAYKLIELFIWQTPVEPGPKTTYIRSEERRVGKECRSRWST